MRINFFFRSMLPVYSLVLLVFIGTAFLVDNGITAVVEDSPLENRYCIIVDAGHGGVDGGATSCTGILESELNLQMATKFNDILHLFGIQTKMVRSDDVSIYTDGKTISSMKMSDLKARARIVNETTNGILVSIHMNYFSDQRYYGPQVFFADDEQSEILAEMIQKKLNLILEPKSNRQIKKADGIYLMQHIDKPGVLIECGFISNPQEELMLKNDNYQKKLCAIFATELVTYISNT